MSQDLHDPTQLTPSKSKKIDLFTTGLHNPGSQDLHEAALKAGQTMVFGLFETEQEQQQLWASDVLILRFGPDTFQRAARMTTEYQSRNPTGLVSVTGEGI